MPAEAQCSREHRAVTVCRASLGEHSQYPRGVGKELISFSLHLPLFPISSSSVLSNFILWTRVFNAVGSSPAAETNASHLAAFKPST